MATPGSLVPELFKTPAVLAVTGRRHGLGNRVRAVLGSRVLARHEGRSFAYTWPVGRNFGATMDSLWDFDSPVVSTVLSRLASHRYPYRDNELHWLDSQARTERLWQIRTPHALLLPDGCPPWEEELRALSLSAAVRRDLLETFARCPAGHPLVGVMIRTNANAHPETLQHSPLSWYLNRMDEIQEFLPEVQFYVSADTPGAFAAVQSRFPHCCGTAEKGRYNSRQALRASVVDVYMLASSCHVLAPHFSSFPELSQRLAGPALRLETSKSPGDTRLLNPGGLSMATDPRRPHVRSGLS